LFGCMIKGNKMYCVSYKVDEEHLSEDGMAMRRKGGGHSLK